MNMDVRELENMRDRMDYEIERLRSLKHNQKLIEVLERTETIIGYTVLYNSDLNELGITSIVDKNIPKIVSITTGILDNVDDSMLNDKVDSLISIVEQMEVLYGEKGMLLTSTSIGSKAA